MNTVSSLTRHRILPIIVVLVLALSLVAVVYAIGIIVDGDDTGDWGTNPTTCTIGNTGCTRTIEDPQDVTSPAAPYYDIKYVYHTNDTTNFYMRLDFWGNGDNTANTWKLTVSGRPLLTICFDIDNNTATGASLTPGWCKGDASMDGVDYIIQVVARGTSRPTDPDVYFCPTGATPAQCLSNYQGTGTAGYDSQQPGGDSDTITELAIPLTYLGIASGSHTCPISGAAQPCPFRMGLYYDNGVASSDDSVPDAGYVTAYFGCNTTGSPCSPTAIQVSTAATQATPVDNLTPIALIGAGAIAVGAIVLVSRRRRTA